MVVNADEELLLRIDPLLSHILEELDRDSEIRFGR